MLCVFFLVVVVGEESVDEARDAREDVAQRGPRVEAVDAPLGVRERERVDARPAPPEGPARHRLVGDWLFCPICPPSSRRGDAALKERVKVTRVSLFPPSEARAVYVASRILVIKAIKARQLSGLDSGQETGARKNSS